MHEWTAETAEWYAAKYGDYPTNRLTIAALSIAEDATVVDIGCGTGSALRRAASKVTSGVLIGIDPVPRMVEIAREQLKGHPAAGRIKILQGPAHALPIDDHIADLVLALDSFDHWGEHKAAGLAEARRILAPGGRFVVVKDGGLPGGPEARRAFSAQLDGAGFRVQSEETIEEADVSFTMWVCVVL